MTGDRTCCVGAPKRGIAQPTPLAIPCWPCVYEYGQV